MASREYFLSLVNEGQLDEAHGLLIETGCVATGFCDRCTVDAIAACRDLAWLAYEQREVRQAIALYDAAAQLVTVSGAIEADTELIYQNNLARCYIDVNDAVTAERLLVDVLAKISGSRFTAMPVYPVALSNLGRLSILQCRLEDATKTFSQSVLVRSKLWGPRHPYVAVGLVQLAGVLLQRRLLLRANALVSRAKRLLESANYCKHLDYALTLKRCGDVQKALGRHQQSNAYYAQAKDVILQARGTVRKLVDSFSRRVCEPAEESGA